MRIEARRILAAPPEDVWKLVAEPYHLADWWPGYQGVEPDRRGLAEGARWRILRGGVTTPGLLRRPGGQAAIVIGRVVPGRSLAWRDLAQQLDVEVAVEPAAERRARVVVAIEAPWWRIALEGLRPLPRQAVARLDDLCQTAADH